MKKISILIAIVLAVSYLFYRFGQFDSTISLSHQIEHILQTHDSTSIESLSLDEQTRDFLLGLPPNTKIHNVSDFQGGTKEIGYFVAVAGNKPLHVFMKVDKQSFVHKLFPKWALFKVTIAPNGTLPSIPEMT